jgi:hypothetical protein
MTFGVALTCAVPSTARRALRLYRRLRGNSKVIDSGPEATFQPRPTASDVPLPVRAVGCGRIADQRGAQVGTAGCGSRRGHSHHPPNKVRQDPLGSAPHFHARRHGRLRPAPRPVSAERIVSLLLSQRSRPPSGRLCGSSNVLRSVAADRLAGAGGSQARGSTIFGTGLPSAR